MNPPARIQLTTLLAQCFLCATLAAQTTWDAGGAADTSINLAANWNNDTANALNGSQAASFGTGGSAAAMNVDGYFSTVTFNRDSSSGFTVNGPGILSVLGLTGSSSGNLSISNTASNGVSTINSGLRINNDAGGTRVLVVDNRESGTTGASLVIAGTLSSSNSSNAYGLRFGGAGSTRITGPITGTLTQNIQQALISGQNFSGTVTIAGNQALGAATVNFASTSSGTVGATARFIMGDSTSDVQSWASSTLNQASTLEIRSTATLSGGVSLSTVASGGSSGGTLDVSGDLNAVNLTVGGATYSGTVKVSGSARFTGTVATGATAGSKIVGGGASQGTLYLTAGTVGASTAIGGAGTDENNIALVKEGTGVLTISRANNTYAGGTTVVNGGSSGAAGLVMGADNALGTGPLVLGTADTTGNGARMRMAGFSQTVSALSTGTTGTRVLENFGAGNSVLTVNGASSTTYAGFLRDRTASGTVANTGGNLGLVKSGNGTLTLSNTSNQYTGATVINGGVLEVALLTNGGIQKAISSTSGSSTVTLADTTGLTNGMTFVAPTLPTGFAVTSVDSGTSITLNTSSGITTGSSTAFFGTASSIGMSGSEATNLVFGGGTLRYTGADTATDRNFTVNVGQNAKWDVSNAASTLTLTGGAAATSGGFQKLGAGTLVLEGAQGYTGTTTLSQGVLRLGASERIDNGSNVVLSGGSLDLNGFSETLGTLLLSASGSLDLDNVSLLSGSVSFADSSSQAWGGFTLSITGTTFGSTSVRFGTDALGLNASQLSGISVNGQGGWTLNSEGYLTAIPEPATVGILAGLVVLAGALLRRRRS